MNNKLDKVVYGVLTIAELTGIGILTAIALKAEANLFKAEIVNIENKTRIKCLEKELAELKSNKGEA